MADRAEQREMTPRKRKLRDDFELRWSQLDAEFSSWKEHYRELSTYLMPRNGRYFTHERNRGGKKHNAIHDNTGTRSLRVTGSGLMAGATSPARPWVRVITNDPSLNRMYPVRAWLDEVTKLILRVFAKSNTYRVLHMMYEELAAFGTAACIVLPDFENVIHCHPLTAGEYRLGTNYKGVVDSCYRTFEKTVHELVTEFGWENCSPDVQDAYNDGYLENRIAVRHVIEPRRERDASKSDNLNMPFRSVYYEVGRDEDKFLRESGFENFPVLAPRWATAGGDTYGHGPGMEALGDIKQLQHEQLRKAQGIDYKTLPPMLAPVEMKGQDMRWAPGGVTHVSSTSSEQGVRAAFQSQVELDHLLMDIQDVRERIRGAFFADLFLMLTFQTGAQRMTATEVAERHEEKLIQLGPVLERLHTELLSPLVQRTYDYLAEAGALPPAPPEISENELTLEFISMLAQAQRAVGVAGLERVLLLAGNVAQAKPEILDNIDEDELWSEITDMIGVSPRVTRDPRLRDKLRQAKLAAQNASAQAAMAQQQAATVKDLASSPTDVPNALRDVTSLFSGYQQPAPTAY